MHPNPFCSERQQEEFRLRHARPGFLDGEVLSDTVTEPVVRPEEVEAWRVPVMDNSDEELHPPYEWEAQAVPEETYTRHTAGGDMLRRTTSAAVREIRALSPSATVGRDSGVAQQSPDRDVADQIQSLQFDQPESQGSGLRVSADHVQADLAHLASGDAELFEGQEQDLSQDQIQSLQLDQPESQGFGLRVSADHVQADLAHLASGDAELFEGQEQDLSQDQIQSLQLDQPESQGFGLCVSADHVQADLAHLASGDAELFGGQEQDLTGAFPEGAETVRNSGRTNVADMGLPHARVNVRDVAQQIAQSGPMTAETGALLQLLVDQHEALQERVVHLEESRSG